jgi:hypothetical protein
MKIYDKLLGICYKKIKSSNFGDKNKCVCVHKVPPFMFGLPVYDLNTAIIYIIDKLKHNGFDAYFNEPNEIHISWRKHVSYYDTSDGTSLDLLESDSTVSSGILNNMKRETESHYKPNYSYPQTNTKMRAATRSNHYESGPSSNPNTFLVPYKHQAMETSTPTTAAGGYGGGGGRYPSSNGYTMKYFKELNRKFLED